MNKQEFLKRLGRKLAGLRKAERDERLGFYAELIDDLIEEGLTEAEAVAKIGSPDAIATQILEDLPKQERKRRLSVTEIVLLSVGSPIWVSLLVAAFSVVFALFVSLWAVLISVWAVFVALAASGLGGVLGGVLLACIGHGFSGIALMGAGFFCAGLSIFAFVGCIAATKATVFLTVKSFSAIFKGITGRRARHD